MKEKQKVLSLRPTQFAVGMLEVDEKIKIVEKYSKKELRKFVKETPVPVVVSPYGELYVTDHHHFLCVCYHVGIETVRVKVIDDLRGRKISFSQYDSRRTQSYFCLFFRHCI